MLLNCNEKADRYAELGVGATRVATPRVNLAPGYALAAKGCSDFVRNARFPNYL